MQIRLRGGVALVAFLAFLIFVTTRGLAQSEAGPEEGGHEVQVWTGGGYSVPGGTSHTGIFDLGLRYGWVITGEHLPGFLRGRFEYAVDAEPAYFIFQPANTAYGVGGAATHVEMVSTSCESGPNGDGHEGRKVDRGPYVEGPGSVRRDLAAVWWDALPLHGVARVS